MRRRFICCVLLLGGCRGQERAPEPSAPPSAKVAPTSTSTAPAGETASATATATATGGAPTAKVFTFDTDAAGAAPAGFSFGRTGDGKVGAWIVKAEAGAPSGANVLAQTDADSTDNRFPVALADEPSLRDVDLSVRCKPVSGKVDQACGMVFRARDANNYYVTRANALEGNVRIYFVKDGKRQQFGSWSGKVTSGAWHDYRVVARGDRFEVYWDGAKVVEETDQTFGDAGKIGLWTKADSVTYFDDLRVEPAH
jgi:hypothetical protein